MLAFQGLCRTPDGSWRFFLHESDDAKGSHAQSLKAKTPRRRAGQFGAQQGDGASKRLTRPPPTQH
jgi:hypothetical protein